MKNKTFRTMLVLLVATLLLFSFTFSASAVDRIDYADLVTADSTVRMRASLQANIYNDYQSFMSVYAGMRFDAIASQPSNTVLNLSVVVYGTGLTPMPSCSRNNVNIGEYIATGDYSIPRGNNANSLYGVNTAQVPGTSTYFYLPNTNVRVN